MSTTSMAYRPLGKCGTKVSALGLGGWTTFGGSITDEEKTRDIITAAYEAGINFFDIADVYARGEAERMMGRVLSDFPRERLVISSKCYWPMSDDVNDRGLSRKHVRESVEKSLARIGTDYLDLYFCHRYDPETPLDETVRVMDDLVHEGKVLYWGTSEWTGAQIEEAHTIAEKRIAYGPQVEQPQYSLLARTKVERDVAPAAKRRGMGLVVWSPLASGLLTGKYDRGVPPNSRLERIDWLRDQLRTDANVAKVREMKTVADRLGVSRTRLAIAWCLANDAVSSVILGATSVEQLKENLGALQVPIDDQTKKDLHAVFGH
jgi:voltage-dependent potassium channel beta subunit